MKRLTLQIDRPCFKAILQGRQKVEHRDILPSTARKYIIQTELSNGEVDVEPVHYDTLYLINGRRKDAPRLEVKIDRMEVVIFTDEDGNDLTYEENGETYIASQIWYYLAEIINTENVPQEFFTEVLPEMDEHGQLIQ